MFDWDKAKTRLEELNALYEDSGLWDNQLRAQNVVKERSYLESAISNILHLKHELGSCVELIGLAEAEEDAELLIEAEAELLKLNKTVIERELECLFSGEVDASSAFVEIHSGAGGTESDDWAAMLFRMYSRWAERHRFQMSLVHYLHGDAAGVKSVAIRFDGKNVYGWLKSESGIHRLVRISPFNSAGKRHTSFASVYVSPVVEDSIEINIQEQDLRVDTYRSSGAGGQHVNTTDSAVRITHLPTGIVVQSQNNRSQHRNKEECMAMLRSRLYELELRSKAEKLNQQNKAKNEISWGHQIRSYVLHPYKMVKDARTGYQESDIEAVLDGKIDSFIYQSIRSAAKLEHYVSS